MGSTSPTRIDDELFDSARIVGSFMQRSASQQVAHWARIGRELESSNSARVRQISDVLSGHGPYDELDPEAQAVVRAEWSEQIEIRIAKLDLAASFDAEGRSYVERGADGTIVTRNPR